MWKNPKMLAEVDIGQNPVCVVMQHKLNDGSIQCWEYLIKTN